MDNNLNTSKVLGKTYVHVDFHTPEYQKCVAKDFNADDFAEELERANVDSISFFAKDCHGMAYYNTEIGIRHPHLDRDLLREALDACKKRNIRVLAYFSLAIDTYIGNKHPEWLQIDSQGNVKGLYDDNAVSWVCLNSAYTDQYFIPMLQEVLENYEVDGYFFDELFYYEDACHCSACKKLMEIQGLDYKNEEDVRYFRTKTCDVFAERVTNYIHSYDEKSVVVYNPTTNIIGIMDTLTPLEDCINVGGHETGWGYLNMPMEARHVRNYDKPILGLTGIFNRRWGDFGTIKNPAQLSYEVAQMLSHHFVIGIGDHLKPDGILESEKYDVMQPIFKEIKDLDLPLDAKPLKDVAIVTPGNYDSAMFREGRSDAESFDFPEANGLSGASKAMLDLHHQFDIITERYLSDNEKIIFDYNLVILPETGALLDETVELIQAYVKQGGKVLISGDSSLIDDKFMLEEVIGARYLSHTPYSHDSSLYYDLSSIDASEEFDEIPMKAYSGGIVIEPNKESESLADYIVPIVCDRHFTATYKGGPPAFELSSPSIVKNSFGEGECIYISSDFFTAYYLYGYYKHRDLLNYMLKQLDYVSLIECSASANLHINLMENDSSYFLHMIHYYPEDAGKTIPRINTMPPMIDATVGLKNINFEKATSLRGATATIDSDQKNVLVIENISQYEIFKLDK